MESMHTWTTEPTTLDHVPLDPPSDVAAVLSSLPTDLAHGKTTDHLIAELHLSVDPEVLQAHLEGLVHAGTLDRRGIGRGAIYSRALWGADVTASDGDLVSQQVAG